MASPSLVAIARERGDQAMQNLVLAVLTKADEVAGGGCTDAQLANMALMVAGNFKSCSIDSILVAIRDGLSSGKVFGKINYPLVAQWINDHLAELVEYNNAQHSSRVRR